MLTADIALCCDVRSLLELKRKLDTIRVVGEGVGWWGGGTNRPGRGGQTVCAAPARGARCGWLLHRAVNSLRCGASDGNNGAVFPYLRPTDAAAPHAHSCGGHPVSGFRLQQGAGRYWARHLSGDMPWGPAACSVGRAALCGTARTRGGVGAGDDKGVERRSEGRHAMGEYGKTTPLREGVCVCVCVHSCPCRCPFRMEQGRGSSGRLPARADKVHSPALSPVSRMEGVLDSEEGQGATFVAEVSQLSGRMAARSGRSVLGVLRGWGVPRAEHWSFPARNDRRTECIRGRRRY
jgi:hypothetical protein